MSTALAPKLEIPPLRYSRLKLMGRSPAHCRYALDQDLAGVAGWDDTPARRLGRLAHAIFLGQPLPAVFTGARRAGKEWDAFLEANAGREVVKQDEFDQAQAMAASLSANDEARELLTGKYIEHTLYFDIAGRNCRATPDVFEPGKYLTDLKTTSDASPDRFPWQALKLGYHGQLTFYKDAVIAAGLPAPERLAIVAVESKPPHVTNVFQFTERAEDFGRRTWRLWFEQFMNCERSGAWPGYIQGVLDAPDEGIELEGLQEVED